MPHIVSNVLRSDQRYAIIDAFQQLEAGERTDKNLTAPGLLISTTQIMATGFNCTRACRLVLIEPDFLEGLELQAFGRIRRFGQMNAETVSIRLITPNSSCENRIMHRQWYRRKLSDAEQAQASIPPQPQPPNPSNVA